MSRKIKDIKELMRIETMNRTLEFIPPQSQYFPSRI